MYEEPDESEMPAEGALDPLQRAKEKFDEFRMHAELVAVFEGVRKFDAVLRAGLDPDIAREVQRGIAKLEKAKVSETPVVDPKSWDDARSLLTIPQTRELPTNDYHISRRPGEVMILRWLAGDEVDA